jgi:hypothetical protein
MQLIADAMALVCVIGIDYREAEVSVLWLAIHCKQMGNLEHHQQSGSLVICYQWR